MRIKCLVLCKIFLLLITACSLVSSLPKNDHPDIGIPTEEINSKFQILAPKGWNSFKIGDDIGLAVRVTTDEPIAFRRDFGARMYRYRKDEWIEVANSMNYDRLQMDVYIIPPFHNETMNEGAAVVAPDLADTTKIVNIRIYLIGNIYENGQITDKETAAFIDMRLNP